MNRVTLHISIAFLAFAFGDIPSVPLYNAAVPGLKMPVMGIGTGGYGNKEGQGGEWWNDDVAEVAVKQWIKLGGRRIDTSLLYFTQKGVGKGIKDSGIDRKELFITSKCDVPGMPHNGSGSGGMYPGGYDITMNSVRTTLEELDTDYIDLMLIHWPGTPTAPKKNAPPCWSAPNNWVECRKDTWRALVELFKKGTLKAIGVSNFEVKHMKEILESGTLPSVNQFEYHPYWQSPELEQLCKKYKITMNGYSPLTTPDHMAFHRDKMPICVIDTKVVIDIAKKYPGKSPSQVILRWELDREFVLNPRTMKLDHMKENMDVFDFKLTAEDSKAIAALQNGQHVCGDPNLIP